MDEVSMFVNTPTGAAFATVHRRPACALGYL